MVKSTTTTALHIFVLMLMSITLVTPLAWIHHHHYIDVSEIYFFATSMREFSTQLFSGDYYPKWLYSVNHGMGAPVPTFYPPVSFYLFALLEFLSEWDPTGVNRIVLSMILATFASATALYIWLKNHLESHHALFAACAFIFVPYRLELVYISSALPHLWAIALFPITMLAVEKMFVPKPLAVGLLTLSLAGIILSHPPSFILFGCIPLIYGIMLSIQMKYYGMLIRIALAYCIAIGISATYLIPFFTNLPLVETATYLTGKFVFEENFTPINYIQAAPYFITALLTAWITSQSNNLKAATKILIWLTLVISICCMALMHPWSSIVWHKIYPLSLLQFPSRWFSPLMIASCILLGFLSQVSNTRWLSALILSVWLITAGFHGLKIHTLLEMSYPQEIQTLIEETIETKRVVPGEYRTIWQPPHLLEIYTLQKDIRSLREAAIMNGQGTLIPTSQTNQLTLLANIISESATIRIKRAYFPGWVAKTNTTTLPVTPSSKLGLIEFELPKGKHTVTVTFNTPIQQTAGNTISIISLILLILLVGGVSQPGKKAKTNV